MDLNESLFFRDKLFRCFMMIPQIFVTFQDLLPSFLPTSHTSLSHELRLMVLEGISETYTLSQFFSKQLKQTHTVLSKRSDILKKYCCIHTKYCVCRFHIYTERPCIASVGKICLLYCNHWLFIHFFSEWPSKTIVCSNKLYYNTINKVFKRSQ